MGDIDSRLDNWQRWLALRDWMPARYRTILGMLYRSPQRNHWDVPVIPPPEIDHLDAVITETTLHKMPDKYLKILILQTMGQYSDGERVIRKVDRMEKYRLAGVSKSSFYREFLRSKIILQNMLQVGKKGSKKGGNSDTVGEYSVSPDED